MTGAEDMDRGLAAALGGHSLFCRWLQDGSARQELDTALAPPAAEAREAVAPFFAATGTSGAAEDWVDGHLADLPAADRGIFLEYLGQLQRGQARTVVTGQQPGDMGGPLYTLHKIATAVALARQLTSRGQPTVPVFWSGDDDDDLAEALAARTYDPVSRRLFGNPVSLAPFGGAGRRRPCVGNLTAARWSAHALRWLRSEPLQPFLGASAARWADLWDRACSEDWSWARLQRRFLLQVFRGTGLLIVSGNDPFLHRTAAPLYAEIQGRRQELARLAREAGAALADPGQAAPLSDRSLHRHLFRSEGAGRVFVEPGVGVTDPGQLRPGVLLRSPVQDWLLQPAAVVVGPGELAYLRQLEPVYRALAVPRCPLVPRLFGWLVPRGFDRGLLNAFAEPPLPAAATASQLACRAAQAAEDEIARLLERELGTASQRARHLARGRARRWSRSVAAMFRAEAQRQVRLARPAEPVWVFPGTSRQERVLSSLTAAALWGDALTERLIAAAAGHLQAGRQDRWTDMVLEVADPSGEAT